MRNWDMWVDRPERGVLRRDLRIYGRTRGGLPLRYIPADQPTGLLVHASIHGTEPDALTTLSSAVRLVPPGELRADVVLALNPEGLLLGTRCNDQGVELNRNFPVGWQEGRIGSRWTLDSPMDTWLTTGTGPLSEPETRGLVELHDERQITHTVPCMARWGALKIRRGIRSLLSSRKAWTFR